jgi:hypothetical protein
MPIDASNKHTNTLVINLRDITRLKDIHGRITSKGPGRKHDVEVLHKSAIVLLVACWEAFVEDMIEATLEWMIQHAKDYKAFPTVVLDRVASTHQGSKAWLLAGDGWKQVLRDNLKEVYARTTATLNTPRSDQVDALFEKTIGLKQVSRHWHWKGRSANQARRSLNDLITLRGSIAHRVSGGRHVRLKDVSDAREFICRLAVKSHNAVCIHAHRSFRHMPWTPIRFRQTI